jgi:hypothetical protein
MRNQVSDFLVRKGKVILCLRMHNPKLGFHYFCLLSPEHPSMFFSPFKANISVLAMKYPPQDFSCPRSSRMQMYTKMEAGWRLIPSLESRCM